MLNFFSPSLCPSLFIVYDWLFEEQGETKKNFKGCCIFICVQCEYTCLRNLGDFYSKYSIKITVKGKALQLLAWAGRDDTRRLRLPDFKTIGT